MRAFSIRQKLLLITMASSTVALLLVATAFLAYEYFSFRQQMKDDLVSLAQVIGDQMTAAITYNDKVAGQESLQTLVTKKSGIIAAGLYTPAGLFVTYCAPGHDSFKFPDKADPDGWQFGRNRLSGFQHIFLNGEDIGAIYIRSDLRELHLLLWRCAVIMLLFAIGALLATYVLASRLQRIISRPIFHLAKTAETVSREKNYAVRAQKESDDELGLLIDGFNGMLAQIQEHDVALQRVNDDLEHRVQERTRDLQQQFSRISLLNQITYAVAARQDIESVVQIVLQQLEDHLPVDYGSAYLFDEKSSIFKVLARGPKTQPLANRLQLPSEVSLADTPFMPCMRGEAVYVPDISQLDSPLAKKVVNTANFCSLGVPLASDGKTFGLLVFMRYKIDGFSPAEREFLHNLSAHVALAIQQIRLYQDLQTAYDELHKTQQAVMQQERLKALGQMASGIAHDINNALSPIVGFSELLGLTENLGPEARKHLGYIQAAGDDITHIVSRLREFYRLRDQNEALLALDLNRLAAQVIEMAAPRWRDIPQGRGVMIEMKREFEPDLPKFAGVESEIREAMLNLIINAVDALPAGGVVTVRTRSAGVDGDLRYVILEVSDTGVGMDEITRKRCLEPFFSTKGQRGTGLGLAMVYGIVERHGGKIEIKSQPGKGTSMCLLFPARAGDLPPEPGSGKEVPPGPFHILSVDDEPTVRELVAKMLRLDGHSVETADGGSSGVTAFRAARAGGTPFEVVITDLGMPYMDGREVAAIIKSESPDTPVIMLTGWGAFMEKQRSEGIDGVLSKPPRLRDLRAMLRDLVTPAAPAGTMQLGGK